MYLVVNNAIKPSAVQCPPDLKSQIHEIINGNPEEPNQLISHLFSVCDKQKIEEIVTEIFNQRLLDIGKNPLNESKYTRSMKCVSLYNGLKHFCPYSEYICGKSEDVLSMNDKLMQRE